MSYASGMSRDPGHVVGVKGLSFGGSTIVLLEDSQGQIDSVRRNVGSLGFELLAAPDSQTIVLLAEAGARFFVLDIKTGRGEGREKAGLDALHMLRDRYGREVFVAVYTALKKQHESAIRRLMADVVVEKSHDTRADIESIVAVWKLWVSQERKQESCESPVDDEALSKSESSADLLFPSDELARHIARATREDLLKILRDRRRIAQALGERPPQYDDLIRELGERMRDELRGALLELAERGRSEGLGSIELARGYRLSDDLARLVLILLPITHGGDEILAKLAEELSEAAAHSFEGEWGIVENHDRRVVANLRAGAAPK